MARIVEPHTRLGGYLGLLDRPSVELPRSLPTQPKNIIDKLVRQPTLQKSLGIRDRIQQPDDLKPPRLARLHASNPTALTQQRGPADVIHTCDHGYHQGLE